MIKLSLSLQMTYTLEDFLFFKEDPVVCYYSAFFIMIPQPTMAGKLYYP